MVFVMPNQRYLINHHPSYFKMAAPYKANRSLIWIKSDVVYQRIISAKTLLMVRLC